MGTVIPGLSAEVSKWIYSKSPSKTGTVSSGAGHVALSASAAVVAFAVCGLVLLGLAAGYMGYIVYREKKYFHPEYEIEHGESTLEGAVHTNALMRAVAERVALALSKEKGAGKKNW